MMQGLYNAGCKTESTMLSASGRMQAAQVGIVTGVHCANGTTTLTLVGIVDNNGVGSITMTNTANVTISDNVQTL